MVQTVKVFYRHSGETRSFDISEKTFERLRLCSFSKLLSIHQVVNEIREKFGDVSEELIIRYLDDDPSSNPKNAEIRLGKIQTEHIT